MVGSRSKGPTDPKEELDDPEKLIRAANANKRKRKAAEEADGPPKEKKAKAAPAKKRKKAKSSGRRKKSKKGKKAQDDQHNEAQGDQHDDNATNQQQDAPPAQDTHSATPEPRHEDDFGSLFGESPAPTRSQTPDGGKKTGEEEPEVSPLSTPPQPYAPVDPRSTYAGKTVPGYSGKYPPGQRRPMAAKQPRQDLLTTEETAAQDTPAQAEVTNAEDTSRGSGLSDELMRALNDRSTPSANDQGSAAATTSAEQPQDKDANSTPGPNDVVQSSETASAAHTDALPPQSISPTTSTSSVRTGVLLTEEQRNNPHEAWREGLQRWRQSLQTAEARPGGLLALAHPMPRNREWLQDDQVTRAIATVSEAIRMRGGPDRAMLGTTAMQRLAQVNRALSSYTQEEQAIWGGPNDFYGAGRPWILPVHSINHWFLAHVRLGPSGVVNVDVYDSLEGDWNRRRTTVRRWIRNSGWYPDDQPPLRDIHITRQASVQQDSIYECGRLTVLNAWALMLGMTPTRARTPPRSVWSFVDETMNLAMQGHMDAATIEAMLLTLGVATGRMDDEVAFNRTVPFRPLTSLDTMLATRAQSGIPVSNGQIRRNAARQQGLDPARVTPEQAQQAHEKLVNDVEASLQNRDPLGRSTPEVDGDVILLLSNSLGVPPDELPESQAERIQLFRLTRSQIRAKAQEDHQPPPSRQTTDEPESSLTNEDREGMLEQLINEIDVISAAATVLDEAQPEGEELLAVIVNLTGRTREELAGLTNNDLEDIFMTAVDKRQYLLEENSEWSFGSLIEGTLSPDSSPSTQPGGLWQPGDPLPPDETLDSNSPLFDRGSENQNGSGDGDAKDDDIEGSDSKDESSKNDDGSGDMQDQDDIGFGPLPGSS